MSDLNKNIANSFSEPLKNYARLIARLQVLADWYELDGSLKRPQDEARLIAWVFEAANVKGNRAHAREHHNRGEFGDPERTGL